MAHVGLNARALTRLTAWAATGVETPMYDSPEQRLEEILFAATLPPAALRHLSAHAGIHLNVEWRDLPEPAWDHIVRTAMGRHVPASQTVWMRTREVWLHAVDLANGATTRLFPRELVDALLIDITTSWRGRRQAGSSPDPILTPTDRPDGGAWASLSQDSEDTSLVVVGPAADLLSWAAGRYPGAVLTSNGLVPPPAPRWL